MLRIYTIYPFASNNDAYPQTATMAAKPPTRLAILMADTPMPNTAAKYGDYGGLFTSLFTTAAQPEPIESILSITKHDIVNHVGSYPSLDDVDAVLITGSKHSAFADDAWIMALVDYTRRALLETNGRVKVVGICFGHQIVARALGGKVVVNEKGWEVAVTEVELTERAREFFGLETLVSLICCDCGGSRGEWNRSAVRLTMLLFFPRRFRESTKCTATSSRSCPRRTLPPCSWHPTTSARSRGCSGPAVALRSRVIRSLPRRLCARFWRPGTTQASTLTTCTTVAYRGLLINTTESPLQRVS